MDATGHQMDHALLAALHLALDQHQTARHHRTPLQIEQARPKQDIDDPTLILNTDWAGRSLERSPRMIADYDPQRAFRLARSGFLAVGRRW